MRSPIIVSPNFYQPAVRQLADVKVAAIHTRALASNLPIGRRSGEDAAALPLFRAPRRSRPRIGGETRALTRHSQLRSRLAELLPAEAGLSKVAAIPSNAL